ncbi:MAG: cytochrome c nitrite reductase small subunit [Bacteroidetes bacterium]|nr:cytochrome c nitrite reductase small subunit [Bacteroidota bacterium]
MAGPTVQAKMVIMAALLGVLAGLGVVTWGYAEGGSYFSNDPRACANCHVMREFLDSWQKSGHHSHATCNDCHTPVSLIPKYFAKAENGMRHSWKFTFQNYPERLRMTAMNRDNLQENCVRCHGDLVIHIAYRPGATGEEQLCVHCHSSVGHGEMR